MTTRHRYPESVALYRRLDCEFRCVGSARGATIVDTLARGGNCLDHARTDSATPVICTAGLAGVRCLKSRKPFEHCTIADLCARTLEDLHP